MTNVVAIIIPFILKMIFALQLLLHLHIQKSDFKKQLFDNIVWQKFVQSIALSTSFLNRNTLLLFQFERVFQGKIL